MLQIHSDLKKLLDSLSDSQDTMAFTTFQTAYIHFRGLVADAAEHGEVYKEWAQRYLLDVSDETGEVIKLHESSQELQAAIEAFIKLIERIEGIGLN